MHTLRRLAATVTGRGTLPLDLLVNDLEGASIPFSTADCRFCANPCEEGHDEYPARFDVDLETDMRGSVKPYRRQAVISTGKTDWAHEVTEEKNTLANYLANANFRPSKIDKRKESESKELSQQPGHSSVPGVFNSSNSSINRVAILNGSHSTVSDDTGLQTVLILPDYKVVVDVEASEEGAQQLWKHVLDPSLGRAGIPTPEKKLKSWVLPYNCVILLCSHKKRDNRCAIAAPKLEHTFSHYLTAEGWSVDTQLEDLSSTGSPLEDIEGTSDEREEEVLRRLRTLDEISERGKRALILKNSHIGGHKFAGNVIIYYPQGASVWYGRVTPHEVCSIVQNTIIGGKILPTLLRGGLNISRPGYSSLRDW